MGVSFHTFEGLGFLRLRVKDSYVWGLLILKLRLRVGDSYVQGLVFLRFWGLMILTIGC